MGRDHPFLFRACLLSLRTHWIRGAYTVRSDNTQITLPLACIRFASPVALDPNLEELNKSLERPVSNMTNV